MKFIRILSLAVTISAIMAFSAFAQIPKGSIVIYDKAYDINLLFDSNYDVQISSAANEHPQDIFYNLTGEWVDIFSDKIVQDFDSWPQIAHTDSNEFTRIYKPQNGYQIQSDLKWTLSNEILIDGPDGDPDSENYILLKFNKPLAYGKYTASLTDLSSGFGHFLSVDGNLGKSNIAAVEWHPESPDELVLYISGAAHIPSPSKISFKLKSGIIKSQNGYTLPPEYLDISNTVWNPHYGE